MSARLQEERIAEFGGSKLHYRIFGSAGNLPDVVLDHGGGGSAEDWNQVIPQLAAHGRVLSYDRAGMGDSPADGLGCEASAVSKRLAQLVAHAGVRKPFILAGYSLGGLYARHYAQQHSQQLAGLVLVDTTPTALEISPARIRKAMILIGLIHWLARSGLATLYSRLGGQKAGEEKEKFSRVVARIAKPTYLKRMREEIDAIAGIQAEVARVAPQLQHPTLAVLAGVAPKYMSPEESMRVRRLHQQLADTAPVPLSRMTVVEGASHGTLMSDPRYAADLASQIIAFARSLPPVAAA